MWLGGDAHPPLVSRHLLQVDDWSPDLIELENKAKQEANVLLFVVDAMTRGIVSMNEATEMVTRGRNVVLVVEFVPADASVDGKTLETREIKVCAKAPAPEAHKTTARLTCTLLRT